MSNVIHGTGKPRLVVITDILEQGEIVSAGSSTVEVTLTNFPSVQALADIHGVAGIIIFSLNNDNEETIAVVTGYLESTTIFTIKYWTNGAAKVGANYYLKDYAIDLPYCQRLTEIWMPDYRLSKRFNGKLKIKKKGFYYRATLDYSQYLSAEVLSKLRNLYRIDRKGILFYPRVDNNDVNYYVDIDPNESLEFYQLQHAQGHGGVIISLIGLERVPEASIYNLETSTTLGYGYMYGTKYGERL